jgi:hypothetical protein
MEENSDLRGFESEESPEVVPIRFGFKSEDSPEVIGTPTTVSDDTITRLKRLVGKKGRIPINGVPQNEATFTILAVETPSRPQEDIETAIKLSTFKVLLDDDLLVDIDGTGAKGTLLVGGTSIGSLNDGDY